MKTNEDFEGGVEKMWVGVKGIPGKQAGEAGAGIITLRAQNGKMVGRRVEHYRKLRRNARGQRRTICVRKGRKRFRRVTGREFTKEEVSKCVGKLDEQKRSEGRPNSERIY